MTNGSGCGSGRFKNKRIILIWNTASKYATGHSSDLFPSAYTVSNIWCSLFQELCRSTASGREGSSTAQEGGPGPNIGVIFFVCTFLWEINIDEIGKL